ncbi:MAG TPA: hypothetical protein DEB25_02060, partial [Desulfobulbaceae bacterium]|nr:hypothetical protein [Desulfobulbaceae bacterium]
MGFWQNLADSYERNTDALKSGYPLSTTTISNNTEWIAVIIIDGDGKFQRCYKIEKSKKDKNGNDIVASEQICLPVTEQSMGRSSGPCPHPVFDQYEYLQGSGEKFDLYIEQLKEFASFPDATPQVKAIYEYIKGKSIVDDLSN